MSSESRTQDRVPLWDRPWLKPERKQQKAEFCKLRAISNVKSNHINNFHGEVPIQLTTKIIHIPQGISQCNLKIFYIPTDTILAAPTWLSPSLFKITFNPFSVETFQKF